MGAAGSGLGWDRTRPRNTPESLHFQCEEDINVHGASLFCKQLCHSNRLSVGEPVHILFLNQYEHVEAG